eukprot:1158157-Pelagomonas_calceolata.AAC.9
MHVLVLCVEARQWFWSCGVWELVRCLYSCGVWELVRCFYSCGRELDPAAGAGRRSCRQALQGAAPCTARIRRQCGRIGATPRKVPLHALHAFTGSARCYFMQGATACTACIHRQCEVLLHARCCSMQCMHSQAGPGATPRKVPLHAMHAFAGTARCYSMQGANPCTRRPCKVPIHAFAGNARCFFMPRCYPNHCMPLQALRGATPWRPAKKAGWRSGLVHPRYPD